MVKAGAAEPTFSYLLKVVPMVIEARLILDRGRDCYYNMAADEAIFILWRRGDPPVLRIYMWKPTSLTLGRGQRVSEVNVDEAVRLGLCVTRRPTGGGALIHPEGFEVTYSIVLPVDHPGLPEDVETSAAHIARAVAAALRSLGVTGVSMPGEPYRSDGPPLCYLRGGSSTVAVRGFKVSGSAQLRVGRKLLQHGTVLLHVEPSLWANLLLMESQVIGSSVKGLLDLGYTLTVDRVTEALVEAFEETLSLSFHHDSLNEDEAMLARSLSYKYSSPFWLKGLSPRGRLQPPAELRRSQG